MERSCVCVRIMVFVRLQQVICHFLSFAQNTNAYFVCKVMKKIVILESLQASIFILLT